MPIELRILSGARAGHSQSFDKPVVTIGRHPASDLQLDIARDLDVSTKHAEIRFADGRYAVVDNMSTNGTFVNGDRVAAGSSRELRDGDVIGFGAQGPTVSVSIAGARRTPVGDRVTESIPTPALGAAAVPVSPASPASGPRRPTQERVAVAVAEQTRKLKLLAGAVFVVCAAIAAAAYWLGHREAAASDARLEQLMARYEQSSKVLEQKLQSNGNAAAVIDHLQRERDSLVRLARAAKGTDASVLQRALARRDTVARAITELDPAAVSRANNPAIALVRAEFAGQTALEATAFAVTANGKLVTNRHVIENNGVNAARVLVKFADADVWRHAHVLRAPADPSVDLVLLQLDDPATVPVVSVASTVDVSAGTPIVSIGFPDGSDLPMNGLKASTTLTVGVVSKVVPEVVQIDSYAAEGSSGSPVFDARGSVVGVIYGGRKGSNGRIVYAVPSTRVVELMK